MLPSAESLHAPRADAAILVPIAARGFSHHMPLHISPSTSARPQHDLLRIYPNLEAIPSNFQIRGMHTILRDKTTSACVRAWRGYRPRGGPLWGGGGGGCSRHGSLGRPREGPPCPSYTILRDKTTIACLWGGARVLEAWVGRIGGGAGAGGATGMHAILHPAYCILHTILQDHQCVAGNG